MDDGTIAWMIRGGTRTETRDDRLQRRQRLDLRMARATAASWRDRLPLGHRAAAAAADPACCPA